jgi:hypothetical protein
MQSSIKFVMFATFCFFHCWMWRTWNSMGSIVTKDWGKPIVNNQTKRDGAQVSN